MLYADDNELEAILVSERHRCVVCNHRKNFAAWRVELKVGGDKAPMCSWCVMYSNQAKWGYENREELSAVGVLCKTTAERSRGKNTHVPKLDARHRLDRQCADRFLLGVQFTSRALKKKLRPVIQAHLKSEE